MTSIRIVESLLVVAGLTAILVGVGACTVEQWVAMDDGTAVASGAFAPHTDAENRTENAGSFNVIAGDNPDGIDAGLCASDYSSCLELTNANIPDTPTCGSVSATPADTPALEQTMLFCNGTGNFVHECSGRTCDPPHPVPGQPVGTVVCDRGTCGVAAYTNSSGGGLQAYDLAQNQFLNTVQTPGCGPSGLDLEGDVLYVSCQEVGEVWTYPHNPFTGAIGPRTSTFPTCAAPSSVNIAPNGQIGITTCSNGLGVLDLVAGETSMVLPCTGCFDAVITDDSTCAYAIGEDVNGFNLDNFTRFAVLESPDGTAPTAIGQSPSGARMSVAYGDGTIRLINRDLGILTSLQDPGIQINVILSVANHPN